MENLQIDEIKIRNHANAVFAPLEKSLNRLLRLLEPSHGYCREHMEEFSEIYPNEWFCESCLESARIDQHNEFVGYAEEDMAGDL